MIGIMAPYSVAAGGIAGGHRLRGVRQETHDF